MTTLQDLVREAARLGATVHLAHLNPPLRGHCDAHRGRIIIRLDLTMVEKKDTLAHELGHLHYGHTCSTDRNERRADRRAARLLIDLGDYRRAESINPDPQAIADELGVTRRIVRVWQREWLPSLSLSRRIA